MERVSLSQNLLGFLELSTAASTGALPYSIPSIYKGCAQNCLWNPKFDEAVRWGVREVAPLRAMTTVGQITLQKSIHAHLVHVHPPAGSEKFHTVASSFLTGTISAPLVAKYVETQFTSRFGLATGVIKNARPIRASVVAAIAAREAGVVTALSFAPEDNLAQAFGAGLMGGFLTHPFDTAQSYWRRNLTFKEQSKKIFGCANRHTLEHLLYIGWKQRAFGVGMLTLGFKATNSFFSTFKSKESF